MIDLMQDVNDVPHRTAIGLGQVVNERIVSPASGCASPCVAGDAIFR